jgi:hypothetical protein
MGLRAAPFDYCTGAIMMSFPSNIHRLYVTQNSRHDAEFVTKFTSKKIHLPLIVKENVWKTPKKLQ